MEKATIKTIAQMSNVSIGTVDRALNGRGRISPETQKRVLEAAEKLDYHRNRFASALGKQRKYHIAVLYPLLPNSFFNFVELGIQEAQKEYEDYGIIIDQFRTDFMNYEEQRETLKSIDKSKYDGLVLAASSEKLIDQLNDFVNEGVPVVTFNSDVSSSNRLFFVGEDAYKSGRLCGSQMGRILGGKGRIAAVVSYLSPGSSQARLHGFMEGLQSKYPDIEILAPRECHEHEDDAKMIVRDLIKQYGELDGIFANSASSTVGIGRFFFENPSVKVPVLIGYDVTNEVGHYLKEGIFDMIVDQNPEKQSYYGVVLMCRHLLENWKPEVSRFEIRVKLVMQDNVDDYCPELNKDGHILL